jgi:hypothetical protein
MDINNLKSMWRETLYTNSENTYSKISIEESISLKHSKVISNGLQGVKLKALLYATILLVYVGIMIYAFLFLRLNLSFKSLIPLGLAGIFLLITTTTEIVRILVLNKTADNFSLKDSFLIFNKKLKRIKTIDFVIYLVFFYLLAILLLFNYLTDIGGISIISHSTEIIPLPLIGLIAFILLSVPWIIKYLNNQRYRKLFSNLEESDQCFKIK